MTVLSDLGFRRVETDPSGDLLMRMDGTGDYDGVSVRAVMGSSSVNVFALRMPDDEHLPCSVTLDSYSTGLELGLLGSMLKRDGGALWLRGASEEWFPRTSAMAAALQPDSAPDLSDDEMVPVLARIGWDRLSRVESDEGVDMTRRLFARMGTAPVTGYSSSLLPAIVDTLIGLEAGIDVAERVADASALGTGSRGECPLLERVGMMYRLSGPDELNANLSTLLELPRSVSAELVQSDALLYVAAFGDAGYLSSDDLSKRAGKIMGKSLGYGFAATRFIPTLKGLYSRDVSVARAFMNWVATHDWKPGSESNFSGIAVLNAGVDRIMECATGQPFELGVQDLIDELS